MVSKIAIKVFHSQSRLDVLEFISEPNEYPFLSPVTYYLGLEIIGTELPDSGILMDLGICKIKLKDIIKKLNGKVIVGTQDPRLEIEAYEGSFRIYLKDETYYDFPKELCYLMDCKGMSKKEICKAVGDEMKKNVDFEREVKGLLQFRVFISNDRECGKAGYKVKFI
ncbi:hypothetical protein SteCoe_18915 [Stentor coeruleus]|uniref:Uncharacterized protein n=1 Tax=Stentor coeruleus TaxID=5963 RepID=A0A1R2BVS5_9CILI|nr:hypothetical protein SteCoe_18915 [Stentor coeruleus]